MEIETLKKRAKFWRLLEEGVLSLITLLLVSLVLTIMILSKSDLSGIEILSLMVFTVTSLSFMLLLYYMAISDMFSDIVSTLLLKSNLPENIIDELQHVKAESSLIRRNFGILLLMVALILKVISLSSIPIAIKLASLLIMSSLLLLLFLLKYNDMLCQCANVFNKLLLSHTPDISPEDITASMSVTRRDLMLRLIAILFFIGVISRFIITCSDNIWSMVLLVSLFASLIIFTSFNFLANAVSLINVRFLLKALKISTVARKEGEYTKQSKIMIKTIPKKKDIEEVKVIAETEPKIKSKQKQTSQPSRTSSEERKHEKTSKPRPSLQKKSEPSQVSSINEHEKHEKLHGETDHNIQKEDKINEEKEEYESSVVKLLLELEDELKHLRNKIRR